MEIVSQSAAPTLPLTLTDVDGKAINIIVRKLDGYVDATDLCTACGKQWNHYFTTAKTRDFLTELSNFEGIPVRIVAPGSRGLIELGKNRFSHTYVHPQVAIHLADWASPRFAVAVTKLIMDYTIEHPDILRTFGKALSQDIQPQTRAGLVYVLQSGVVPTRVKIGHSHQSLADLRERYRTAFPDKVRIYALEVDDSYAVEQDMHAFFDDQREAGEWFGSERLDQYLEYLTNVYSNNLLIYEDADFKSDFHLPTHYDIITR
jgi:hypothetical protein